MHGHMNVKYTWHVKINVIEYDEKNTVSSSHFYSIVSPDYFM